VAKLLLTTEEEKAEKFYLLKMKMPALVGKKDFDNVFKNSDTSFSSGPFVVILKKNEISSVRTGIIIQKKFVKLAVNRNYIKRKFRDIIIRSKLNSFDAVLMVKNKIEEFDKVKVKTNFIDLESKIEKI
jgi:ribonuclease P protein component